MMIVFMYIALTPSGRVGSVLITILTPHMSSYTGIDGVGDADADISIRSRDT